MRTWYNLLLEITTGLQRLRPHLRGGRYLLAAVIISTMLASLLDGLGLSLLLPLLYLLQDNPTNQAGVKKPTQWLENWFPHHEQSFYVILVCLLVLLTIASKNLVYLSSQVLTARLRLRMGVNLREALFRRLHYAELAVFEQHPAGEITSVFLSETNRTLWVLDHLLLLGQWGSLALFYVILLFLISWPLTLMATGLAVVIGGFVSLYYRRLLSGSYELTRWNQKLNALLMESFAGVRVVRATHSEAREIARFREVLLQHGKVEERSVRTHGSLRPLAETLTVAGAMTIVGCGYVFFVKGGAMSSSYLLGFGVALLRLLPILNQLYGLQGHLVWLSGGMKEVEKWIATPQHPQRSFGAVDFSGIRSEIRFEEIGFVYPNGKEALKDISFEIPRGKTVALVGSSGSGKSTIAALLLRLRQSTEGRIRVDGRDYWEFTAESWHSAVAVVEQEAFLFHDTLEQNIAYGYPKATAEGIQTAVRRAHLEDLVKSLPLGLKTLVGERGTMLSGGQRQRLAIARALVRNPQILILDEATSALDSISERQVQAALEEAVADRTVLVIAHRLSTVRNVDHIVVLDGGRVVEQGSWDELEHGRGAFSKLLNTARSGAALVG
jgi:ATP-binding cassette, subfamily B, bacterial MsbA